LDQVAIDRVPLRPTSGLDLERDAFLLVEGVDLVGAFFYALFAEQDRSDIASVEQKLATLSAAEGERRSRWRPWRKRH
jgi:hypothetical protein